MASTCAELDAAIANLTNKINQLQAKVDSIPKVNEESIIQKAISGVLTASQFLSVATSANQALGMANNAMNTGNNAMNAANNAIRAGNNAINSAKNAINTANTAKNTANALNNSLDLIRQQAGNAERIAANAQSTARNALGKAGEAIGNSKAAQAVANTASNVAGKASIIATALTPLVGVVGAILNIVALAGAIVSLAQLAGTIGVIFPRLDGHDRAITQLSNDQSRALSTLSLVNSKVDRNTQSIESLNRKTDVIGSEVALQGLINAGQNARIDAATSTANNALFKVNNLEPKVRQLEVNQDGLIRNQGQLEANQNQLSGRVNAVEGETFNLNQRIGTFDTKLNSVNSSSINRDDELSRRINNIRLEGINLQPIEQRVSRLENNVIPPIANTANATANTVNAQIQPKLNAFEQSIRDAQNIANKAQSDLRTQNAITTTAINQSQQDFNKAISNSVTPINQALLTQNQLIEQAKQEAIREANLTQQQRNLELQQRNQAYTDSRINQQIQPIKNQVNQLQANAGTQAMTPEERRLLEQTNQNTLQILNNGLQTAGTVGLIALTVGTIARGLTGITNVTNVINNNVTNIVNGAGNAAVLAQTTIINNKLGNQITGGISQHLTNGFNLVNKIANSQAFNTAMVALTYWTTLHNASMLSVSLVDTLFSTVNTVLSALGLKQTTVNPDGTIEETDYNIGSIVTNFTQGFFISIFGVERLTQLNENWVRLNTIYQSAYNVFSTLQGLGNSIYNLAQIGAERIGIVANALKRSRAVEQNSYKDMSETVNGGNALQTKLDRFQQGAEVITEPLNIVNTVASEVITSRDLFAQLKDQKTAVNNALAGSEEIPLPTYIENYAAKQRREQEILASKNPIELADVDVLASED